MDASYRLTEKEFDAISCLDGPDRYSHFVKRVSDWQRVWGLKNESGWVTAGDDNGNNGIPFWPHPDYASACATGEWSGNHPASIEVHEFVDSWLPNMEKDGVQVTVFPTASLKGVMVHAAQLQADLSEELEQYE
jgi:hypothetical protein